MPWNPVPPPQHNAGPTNLESTYFPASLQGLRFALVKLDNESLGIMKFRWVAYASVMHQSPRFAGSAQMGCSAGTGYTHRRTLTNPFYGLTSGGINTFAACPSCPAMVYSNTGATTSVTPNGGTGLPCGPPNFAGGVSNFIGYGGTTNLCNHVSVSGQGGSIGFVFPDPTQNRASSACIPWLTAPSPSQALKASDQQPSTGFRTMVECVKGFPNTFSGGSAVGSYTTNRHIARPTMYTGDQSADWLCSQYHPGPYHEYVYDWDDSSGPYFGAPSLYDSEMVTHNRSNTGKGPYGDAAWHHNLIGTPYRQPQTNQGLYHGAGGGADYHGSDTDAANFMPLGMVWNNKSVYATGGLTIWGTQYGEITDHSSIFWFGYRLLTHSPADGGTLTTSLDIETPDNNGQNVIYMNLDGFRREVFSSTSYYAIIIFPTTWQMADCAAEILANLKFKLDLDMDSVAMQKLFGQGHHLQNYPSIYDSGNASYFNINDGSYGYQVGNGLDPTPQYSSGDVSNYAYSNTGMIHNNGLDWGGSSVTFPIGTQGLGSPISNTDPQGYVSNTSAEFNHLIGGIMDGEFLPLNDKWWKAGTASNSNPWGITLLNDIQKHIIREACFHRYDPALTPVDKDCFIWVTKTPASATYYDYLHSGLLLGVDTYGNGDMRVTLEDNPFFNLHMTYGGSSQTIVWRDVVTGFQDWGSQGMDSTTGNIFGPGLWNTPTQEHNGMTIAGQLIKDWYDSDGIENAEVLVTQTVGFDSMLADIPSSTGATMPGWPGPTNLDTSTMTSGTCRGAFYLFDARIYGEDQNITSDFRKFRIHQMSASGPGNLSISLFRYTGRVDYGEFNSLHAGWSGTFNPQPAFGSATYTDQNYAVLYLGNVSHWKNSAWTPAFAFAPGAPTIPTDYSAGGTYRMFGTFAGTGPQSCMEDMHNLAARYCDIATGEIWWPDFAGSGSPTLHGPRWTSATYGGGGASFLHTHGGSSSENSWAIKTGNGMVYQCMAYNPCATILPQISGTPALCAGGSGLVIIYFNWIFNNPAITSWASSIINLYNSSGVLISTQTISTPQNYLLFVTSAPIGTGYYATVSTPGCPLITTCTWDVILTPELTFSISASTNANTVNPTSCSSADGIIQGVFHVANVSGAVQTNNGELTWVLYEDTSGFGTYLPANMAYVDHEHPFKSVANGGNASSNYPTGLVGTGVAGANGCNGISAAGSSCVTKSFNVSTTLTAGCYQLILFQNLDLLFGTPDPSTMSYVDFLDNTAVTNGPWMSCKSKIDICLTCVAGGSCTCSVVDTADCHLTDDENFGNLGVWPALPLGYVGTAPYQPTDVGSVNVVVTAGTGPFDYVWTNAAAVVVSTTLGSASTTNTVNGLPPGTYTCTVTDSTGSTFSNFTTIAQPVAMAFTTQPAVTNPTCTVTTGSITGAVATAGSCGGAVQYALSTSNVSIWNTITANEWIVPGLVANTAAIWQANSNFTAVPSGTYYVWAQSSCHCAIHSTQIVVQAGFTLTATIAASTSTPCTGAPLILTVTAVGTPGYSYVWTTGPGLLEPGFIAPPTTSSTYTQSTPGNYDYTVVVTDAMGCTVTVTFLALSNSCAALGGIDSGFQEDFSQVGIGVAIGFDWLSANQPAAPFLLAPTLPGFYYFEMDPTAGWIPNPNQCVGPNGGLLSAIGVVYFQEELAGNVVGNLVTNPPLINTINDVVTAINNLTGNIGLVSVGMTFSQMKSAYNTFTGGDGSGSLGFLGQQWIDYGTLPCICTSSYTPAINLNSIVHQIGCSGGVGWIDASVLGGTAPFTYSWVASGGGNLGTNSPTGQDLTNLPAGTYTLTVTDAVGCTDTDVYTINPTFGLEQFIDLNPYEYNSIYGLAQTGTPYEDAWYGKYGGPTCIGGDDGSIRLILDATAPVTGAAFPYDVEIRQCGTATWYPVANNAGVPYTGAVNGLMLNWDSYDPGTGLLTSTGLPYNHLTDGSIPFIFFELQGGTGGDQWNPGGGFVPLPFTAGSCWEFRLTEFGSSPPCEVFVTTTILPSDYQLVDVGTNVPTLIGQPSCCGCSSFGGSTVTNVCNGSLDITPTLGTYEDHTTATYSYLWTYASLPTTCAIPGHINVNTMWVNQTTQDIASEWPGTYTVTVTDSCGGTDTETTDLLDPIIYIDNIEWTHSLCAECCDGTITISAHGGNSNLQVSIDNMVTWSPMISNPHVITGVCPGIKTIWVRDDSFCSVEYFADPDDITYSGSFLENCFADADITGVLTTSGTWTPTSNSSVMTTPVGAAFTGTAFTRIQINSVSNFTAANPCIISHNLFPGGTDGEISLNLVGGNAPYTITIQTLSGPVYNPSNPPMPPCMGIGPLSTLPNPCLLTGLPIPNSNLPATSIITVTEIASGITTQFNSYPTTGFVTNNTSFSFQQVSVSRDLTSSSLGAEYLFYVQDSTGCVQVSQVGMDNGMFNLISIYGAENCDCICPLGFTFDGDPASPTYELCLRNVIDPVCFNGTQAFWTLSSTQYPLGTVPGAWGALGGALYGPWIGGSIMYGVPLSVPNTTLPLIKDIVAITPNLFYNDNTGTPIIGVDLIAWNTVGLTSYINSRIPDIAIWPMQGTWPISPPPPPVPTNCWIGCITEVNFPGPVEVIVCMASNERMRLKIDGLTHIEMDGDDTSPITIASNEGHFNMFPLVLPAGIHTISFEVNNLLSHGFMAFDVISSTMSSGTIFVAECLNPAYSQAFHEANLILDINGNPLSSKYWGQNSIEVQLGEASCGIGYSCCSQTSTINQTPYCDALESAWIAQGSNLYSPTGLYYPGQVVLYTDPAFGVSNYYIASANSASLFTPPSSIGNPQVYPLPVAPNVCCYGGPPCVCTGLTGYWEACSYSLQTAPSLNSTPSISNGNLFCVSSITAPCEIPLDCGYCVDSLGNPAPQWTEQGPCEFATNGALPVAVLLGNEWISDVTSLSDLVECPGALANIAYSKIQGGLATQVLDIRCVWLVIMIKYMLKNLNICFTLQDVQDVFAGFLDHVCPTCAVKKALTPAEMAAITNMFTINNNLTFDF